MNLDFSKLSFDPQEPLKQPNLYLQTLAGKNLGILHGVHDLTFSINYAELSEISFTIPFMHDGIVNPLYRQVVGYKVIYTKDYGVYLLAAPKTNGEGLEETKTVSGYSLEKTFERKRLFLSEGTYNFYDPISPEDTILGRFLETDKTWEVGYVAPELIGCYRTFDEYNDTALSFIYNTVPEKFRCLVVFDPYKDPVSGKRRIHVYSADEDVPTVPVYLSYENLLENAEVEELTDELVTKLHVYGADSLSIREVNPIGTDYLVNLDYFIQNGDISPELAQRIDVWQAQIAAKKEYYTGLISLRASETAQKIALQAELTDLNGELETLTAQQSITIQAIALETTAEGIAAQQALLDEINTKIAAKKTEISDKEQEIEDAETAIAGYNADILSLNGTLSYETFFTEEERLTLDQFLIEDTVSEESFVATDIDTSVSGAMSSMTGGVSISGAEISEIDLQTDYGKMMYAVAGGKAALESIGLTADIIRGTLEVKDGAEYVCSLYLGACTYGDTSHSSGMLTLSGVLSNFTSDIQLTDDGGLQLRKGTSLSFDTADSNCFFSVNISDYQKYSVSKELYDYGQEILSEVSQPTYEFTIDSANFLCLQEFAPFKNKLNFGRGVHIDLRSEGQITAALIGIELDFGDISSLGLTFSNRFQRHDGQARLKEMIGSSYSSSKSFDASKYIYNHAANKASEVSQFMKSSLDAAVNTIIGASNQSVLINGAGIQIGGGSMHQMRIVDNMIAITDDGWQTAKLAIGLFTSDTLGTYYGINADVLAGKITLTNNLIVESVNDEGVTQFRVDATGAWLNNAVFVLQKDNGKILIDPTYGIVAGTSSLFTTSGTTVSPSFIGEDGSITFDSDGMPENANFFLDVSTGAAYLRGKIQSTSGKIGGWYIKDGYLYSGSGASYVALNASGSNSYSQYAIWAGAENPASAKFSVLKNGTVSVEGALNAKSLKINGVDALTSDKIKGSVLDLKGVTVSNGTSTTFSVDANGNVTILGNITMGTGSTINWATVTQQNGSLNDAIAAAKAAQSAVNGITYTVGGTTYIDESCIYAGSISADALHLGGDLTIYKSLSSATVGGYLGYTTSANDGSAGMHMQQDQAEVVVTANGAKLLYTLDTLGVSSHVNQIYVTSSYATMDIDGSAVSFSGSSFAPSERTITLGLSGSPWGQVYSTNSAISTSDRNMKTDIAYAFDLYEKLFMELRPAVFRLKDGDSGRLHTGFIAQDVEDAIRNAGLTSKDFAAFIKSVKDDGSEYYGLRYEEFIALNTYMIQKLIKEFCELRAILEEQ